MSGLGDSKRAILGMCAGEANLTRRCSGRGDGGVLDSESRGHDHAEARTRPAPGSKLWRSGLVKEIVLYHVSQAVDYLQKNRTPGSLFVAV